MWFKVSYCEDREGGIFATPLQLAAMCGKSAICLFLINSGARIENPTDDGKTPLHWSTWFGHKETSLKLINAGSKVDAKTKVGDTPLMLAAYRGYADIVQLLLDRGADKNLTNNDGLTALEFVENKDNRQDIVAILNYAL